MVSYGPWQPQGPDQNQFSSLNIPGSGNDPIDGLPVWGYGASGVHVESGWQDPPYAITTGDLGDAVAAVTPPGPEGVGSPESLTSWGTAYTWSYESTIVPPSTNSLWEAEALKRWFRITPGEYAYSPVSEGFWDPDAIGIDYAGQPYNPSNPWASGPAAIVSRGLSTAFTRAQGMWHDDAIDPLDRTVPDSATRVMLRPLGAAVDVTLGVLDPPAVPTGGVNPDVATRGLSAAIDLTPYLEDTGWAGTVWTEQVTKFVPPTRETGPVSTGTVRYGWGFDRLRIDTWVRPPLWRWVYAGELATPYRRIFPRDDGLAGGAPRNYPTSKSRQSSNRTSGYL